MNDLLTKLTAAYLPRSNICLLFEPEAAMLRPPFTVTLVFGFSCQVGRVGIIISGSSKLGGVVIGVPR